MQRKRVKTEPSSPTQGKRAKIEPVDATKAESESESSDYVPWLEPPGRLKVEDASSSAVASSMLPAFAKWSRPQPPQFPLPSAAASSSRSQPPQPASSSLRRHASGLVEAVEVSDFQWPLVRCPGCLSVVLEEQEHYRTQRTIWHQACFDNKPQFPMFDVCPYCHVKVEVEDKQDEFISASGHSWHRSCHLEYLEQKEHKKKINLKKKQICPGCRRDAQSLGVGVITSRSNQRWCKPCWDERCNSSVGSFQQARDRSA